MLDRQIWGSIDKIANETPIPVLLKTHEKYSLGGCGNVLSNLSSLTPNKLFLFAVTGNDSNGSKIEHMLEENDIHYILEKSRYVTTTKTRFFCENRLLFRFDDEMKYILDGGQEDRIYQSFIKVIENNTIDSIVFSDYNKGFLTPTLCEKIINKSNEYGIFTVVDPKNSYEKYKLCSLIKPNRAEVERLFGIRVNSENLHSTLKYIKNTVNCKHVVITLADKGIAYIDDSDKIFFNEPEPIEVIDVTGAGDIVSSVISYYFPSSEDKQQIIILSSLLATESVKHAGTYIITEKDILFAKHYLIGNKLTSVDYIKGIKLPIVFTNGCFDLLHIGHLELFKFCKTKYRNHILVVALNTDDSIRRIKGSSRPINNINARTEMLNAIKWVDYILTFDSDTPIKLIEHLRPDIIVKGGDYTYDSIIGKEYCRNIEIFDIITGVSTTNTISRIKLLQ
jgi:D-beta-D-heptose 7-phosphate kinase/D-beta-D-heptose 1-phosphate adenosyltransferase